MTMPAPQSLAVERVTSPLGEIVLVSSESGLCSLDFSDCAERMTSLLELRFGRVELNDRTRPSTHVSALRAYLDGDLGALDAIAIDTRGTAFQERVWKKLRGIRVGCTTSYGQLARDIGRPTAARAVGAANGRNPVALVVPCHRVVAADGRLTGYAGGLERKRWLLDHEHAPPAPGAVCR